jgi:hypothetical protein
VTTQQQIRWGVFLVYAVGSAEALIAFDQTQASRWMCWAGLLVAAASAVALWNRRRPGETKQ